MRVNIYQKLLELESTKSFFIFCFFTCVINSSIDAQYVVVPTPPNNPINHYMIKTDDGGYVICYTLNCPGNAIEGCPTGFTIIKYDKDLNAGWSRSILAFNGQINGFGGQMYQLENGDIAIFYSVTDNSLGIINHQYRFLKLSGSGTTITDKTVDKFSNLMLTNNKDSFINFSIIKRSEIDPIQGDTLDPNDILLPIRRMVRSEQMGN